MESSILKRSRTKHKQDLSRCRKHPKHFQEVGICSLCLNEKLSHLHSKQKKGILILAASLQDEDDDDEDEEDDNDSLSSSPSSASSCYSSSSCSSPVHSFRASIKEGQRHRSGSSMAIYGKSLLKKSRSLVFVSSSEARSVPENKKKSGFWSMFMLRAST